MSRLEVAYSSITKCYCSPIDTCETPAAIVDDDLLLYYETLDNFSVSYLIPGSIVGCTNTDSLFLSTLECFYSDSNCLHILKRYLEQTYMWNTDFVINNVWNVFPQWFNATSLVYNSTSTSFYRNSSISTIIRNLFIEQWNPSYSYNDFYRSCSPNYCNFQERIHANNAIGIVVVLISMIGGLIISIRLITPHLIMLIGKLISTITRKEEQERQQQPGNSSQKRI